MNTTTTLWQRLESNWISTTTPKIYSLSTMKFNILSKIYSYSPPKSDEEYEVAS
jgi:hypothetical protein